MKRNLTVQILISALAENAAKTLLNKALASTELGTDKHWQGTGKTLIRHFWQQDKHVMIHMAR